MQETIVDGEAGITERTAALRRAFDQRFEAPPPAASEATIDVLTVRIDDVVVAVRVEDVAHVEARVSIVGVPDAPRGCLGVASHRGALVAVFDLATLLGLRATSEPDVVLVSRSDASIAFAVSAVCAYRRVAISAIAPRETEDPSGVELGTLTGEARGPAISLAALTTIIAAREHGEPS